MKNYEQETEQEPKRAQHSYRQSTFCLEIKQVLMPQKEEKKSNKTVWWW